MLRRRGGFLSMTPAQVQAIAALGVAARKAKGAPGHRWTSAQAREASLTARRRAGWRGNREAALAARRTT
jgi:hypothetical protein